MRIKSAILPILWLAAGLVRADEPTALDQRPPLVAPSSRGESAYGATATTAAAAGDQLLAQAVLFLDRQRTVTAKVRQRADMFGHPLVGNGSYSHQIAEHGPHSFALGADADSGIRFRLDIKAALPDQSTSSMLHVCDGRNLWMHQELPLRGAQLSRIDIRRVKAALERRDVEAAPAQLITIGGLPKMMAGLQKSFCFTEVREGKLEGLDVWVLDGTWRAEHLVRMLPDQKAAIDAGEMPQLHKLPQQTPAAVELLLGKNDLFPYRIEYRKPAGKQPSPSLIDASAWQVLSAVEFFEVKLNVPLEDRTFEYQPGNVEVMDETDKYLHGIGLGQK